MSSNTEEKAQLEIRFLRKCRNFGHPAGAGYALLSPEDAGAEIREFVATGGDLNARDAAGSTGLIAAIVTENRPFITALIRAGADKTARNRYGETAESVALKLNDRATLELLAA